MQVRCNGCREWFDGFYHSCPECGHVRPPHNKWLRHAQLNAVLNEQKARVVANR